ncbi:DsbA family protein [Paenibacillus humicus]|uniref:DsbA family protein n=1 Tax=Paenibacillus humicus TaxID=412861 RepID=UPI003F189DD7
MRKTKKSSNIIIYALVFLVLCGAIFFINQMSNSNDNSNPSTTASPYSNGQPIVGDKNAKVSIVEFGDYKCPACKNWGEQVWPKLKEDYVDTGMASFAYVNTLFHGEESRLSAQASESIHLSYPEQFWDFHKAMFDEQPSKEKHDDLWVTEAKVLAVAKATIPELNVEQFKEDMKSSQIQERLNQDQLLVDQLNIEQTPTIMVNNVVIVDPFNYEEIQKAIEQEAK